MKRLPAYRGEGVAERIPATRPLRVVSRVAPSRPRWGRLYLALGVIVAVGSSARFMVDTPVLLKVVDGAFAFALFVALAGWVQLNRVALARMGEPDTDGGRPRIRIVRSRERSATEISADDGVVRLDPDDRVILPYDFK